MAKRPLPQPITSPLNPTSKASNVSLCSHNPKRARRFYQTEPKVGVILAWKCTVIQESTIKENECSWICLVNACGAIVETPRNHSHARQALFSFLQSHDNNAVPLPAFCNGHIPRKVLQKLAVANQRGQVTVSWRNSYNSIPISVAKSDEGHCRHKLQSHYVRCSCESHHCQRRVPGMLQVQSMTNRMHGWIRGNPTLQNGDPVLNVFINMPDCHVWHATCGKPCWIVNVTRIRYTCQ